ncbi:alpha/beta hydrolase [Klebsiella pneumoniae]|uniref:alpha/beta hydrolase n=1 Tax=Klebsiella pneumoniae TaxID=573 RepID=UPI001E523C69|nr:alpha/beta hydrolase [Klebsiella pneumoniae]MCC4960278.1 alpha/beta hydrolase [Klebsiella pneumoniae]
MKKQLCLTLISISSLFFLTSSVFADTQEKRMNPIPQGGPTLQDKSYSPSFSDVSYGEDSSTQKLDIYLPMNTKGPYPVVIYAHPGGFKFGNKRMASFSIVDAILKKGYAFVSVDYRLSGESRFPAAVQDFFRASEFITSHANQYQLNPQRLYFYGESAGANIVSLAGLAFDDPTFNAGKKHPQNFIRPEGVMALYPPVDFSKIQIFVTGQGCPVNNDNNQPTLEEQYLGGTLSDNQNKVNAANPATYVKNNAPSFFIENGSNDCNVGTGQSKILVNALKKYNIPVSYKMIEGAGHGGLPFETSENIRLITDFLK